MKHFVKSILTLTLATLSSLTAAERPRLQILNGSSQPVDIFWLKTDMERVPNGSVEPGKDAIITTTIGHRFAVVGREDQSETTVTSEVPVQGFRFGGLPAIYTQSVSAGGFPIVASAKVNPYALKEAAHLADLMLAQRPDVRAAMVKSGARMCIMAHDEYTTDLPEWAHLTPKDYRDARARGMGGSETDPYCSCAEENVLGYPGDPYSTECIVIHEFAHNIHLRGMVNVDPTFDPRLKAAYDAAMKAGLWKAAYASVNHHEYFAEGVQNWFDNNRENDNEHNHVNTRAELLAYDPGLAALCREVFGDTVIKYTKPATRLTGHMAGYDPAQAPTFAWPERLKKAKAEISEKVKARNEAANGRETRDLVGWSVRISRELLASHAAATDRAVELLKAQFEEIVRVVPPAAVAELQKVPVYLSPEYPGVRPKAEYHPAAGWLREQGRDLAMAKAVEITSVLTFDVSVRRMPMLMLHELAHGYHDRVLSYDHAEIKAAYEKAKASGKYESVERQDAEGRKRMDRAYALTNPQEYFAESTEAYFGRNDFFPYTRAQLREHDPEMFALVGKVWGVTTMAAEPPPRMGESEKLHALFDAEWEHTMQISPTWASHLGDRRYNDRWSDVSLAAIDREHEHSQRVLAQLDAIRRDALPPADRLNYDLFRLRYEQSVEGFRFGQHLIPLTQREGIQTEDELASALRFETVKDYEDWIARLRSFGHYVDQTIALMREGMKRGLVQPKVTMQRVPAQIAKQLVARPEESPFFKPLQQIAATIGAADRERLTAAAKAAIAESVLPAYRRFEQFFSGEYLPACLDGIGAWRLPDGEALYAFTARTFTTTKLTPQEIHEIGLREVARIRGEMEKVKTRAGFAGTLPEFFAFLRTDRRFYCDDENQLFLEYLATSKRIDPLLVKLFRTLPRAPYGLERIPAKMAPDTTAAYYRQPAADGSRAGSYFVNTYKPESRPRWEMMALSLHEAVPGHHFQIALAQEQGALPKFRQHTGYTAYVEGWALYAEALGDELGLYADHYDKMGQLTYEMWRAVRLVVDTGIHAFQWEREKAIAFFRENAPKTEQDIVNEIDRYISWPGQALAYKIGELKIKELRARATQQLGEKFDVKEFHDVILLGGAMPLEILEARVDEWLRSKTK